MKGLMSAAVVALLLTVVVAAAAYPTPNIATPLNPTLFGEGTMPDPMCVPWQGCGGGKPSPQNPNVTGQPLNTTLFGEGTMPDPMCVPWQGCGGGKPSPQNPNAR